MELALSTEAFEVHVRDHGAPVPHAPLLNATATLNSAAAKYLAILPMTVAGDLHLDITYLGTSLAGFPKAVLVYPGSLSPSASSIRARPCRVGTLMELRLAARDEFGNLVRPPCVLRQCRIVLCSCNMLCVCTCNVSRVLRVSRVLSHLQHVRNPQQNRQRWYTGTPEIM